MHIGSRIYGQLWNSASKSTLAAATPTLLGRGLRRCLLLLQRWRN